MTKDQKESISVWLVGLTLFLVFFVVPTIKAFTVLPTEELSWWLYPLIIGLHFIGYVILYFAVWFILWTMHSLYELIFITKE